ncbi:MAG: hypothetical protein HXS48_04755 [Theionarchaea archaeon]|nr:MAG: hypothetical protein AYK19_08535 [Theionarchaea archaeon DG-70-1]MBU7026231.1 hypothetical protein [Theionarchaea archaeon]
MNEKVLMEITVPDNIILRDEVDHDMVLAFNNATQDLIVIKGRSRCLLLEVLAHKRITDALLKKMYEGMSQQFFEEDIDSETWNSEVLQFIMGLHEEGFLIVE